ncbi:MAG: hypothetical protein OXC80_14430 [Gammaproteobacteria bacterium]|nr:hypothetical protein [Gammaproteobacteria bacterium]
MDWINRMLRRPPRAELEARNAELESGIYERDSALAELDAEIDRLRTRLATSTDVEDGERGSLAQAGEELVELLRRARADDVKGRLDFTDLEESMLKGSHKLASALLGETLKDVEAVRQSSEVTCPRCSGQMRFERRHKRRILSRLGFL